MIGVKLTLYSFFLTVILFVIAIAYTHVNYDIEEHFAETFFFNLCTSLITMLILADGIGLIFSVTWLLFFR